jgi:hypothetical protein
MTATPPPSSLGSHRLDLSNAEEVAFWLYHFSCSELTLRNAVAFAGSLLEDVERYFYYRDTYFYLAARQRANEPHSFAVFQGYQHGLNP